MGKRGVLRVRMMEFMVQQTTVDGTILVTTRLLLETGTHPRIMMATRVAGTTATRTIGGLVIMPRILAIPTRPTLGFEGSLIPNLPSLLWLNSRKELLTNRTSRYSIAHS